MPLLCSKPSRVLVPLRMAEQALLRRERDAHAAEDPALLVLGRCPWRGSGVAWGPPVHEAEGPVVNGEPHDAHVVRVEHAVAEANTLPLSHHPGRAARHLR